jgi:hypothetical protein
MSANATLTKTIDKLTEADLQATFNEVPLATDKFSVFSQEFILALNGAGGSPNGNGGDKNWQLQKGPVSQVWYQLVDNLSNLKYFDNITVLPSQQAGRPVSDEVIITFHDTSDHHPALLRIKVFALVQRA